MHARAGAQGSDGPLYGLCNNAGIGFGRDVPTTLATNLYGAKRVSDSFVPLIADGGRVCNIASASGPMFVAGCEGPAFDLLSSRSASWEELETLLRSFTSGTVSGDIGYGLSKVRRAPVVVPSSEEVLSRAAGVRTACAIFDSPRGPGRAQRVHEYTRAQSPMAPGQRVHARLHRHRPHRWHGRIQPSGEGVAPPRAPDP